MTEIEIKRDYYGFVKYELFTHDCRICGKKLNDATINSKCPYCDCEGDWANDKEILSRVRQDLMKKRVIKRVTAIF